MIRTPGREAGPTLPPPYEGATTLLALALVWLPAILAGQVSAVTLPNLEPSRTPAFMVDTIWAVGGPDDAGGVVFGAVGGVAIGRDGTIYAADFRLQTVHVLNRAGRLIHALGRSGDGPGEFRLPTRVAVAPDGQVFVLDEYQGRVSEFSPDHRFVRSVTLVPRRAARSFLVTNDAFVLTGIDPSPNGPDAVVQVYDRATGEFRHAFGQLYVVRDATVARRAAPGPLALGSDGTWWYAAPGPYRIEQFSAAGAPLLRIERRNGFLGPAEDGVGIVADGDRLTFSHRPRAVVARIHLRPGGIVLHQVSTVEGEVITDVLRVTGTGAAREVRLVRSSRGSLPVLGAQVGPDEYVVQTLDAATGANWLMLVRVRGEW